MQPQDGQIALQRIDMIAAHDTLDRLSEITAPTLALSGTNNACTTLPNSEELAHRIPGAQLVILPEAGELIELEQEDRFFDKVTALFDHHS